MGGNAAVMGWEGRGGGGRWRRPGLRECPELPEKLLPQTLRARGHVGAEQAGPGSRQQRSSAQRAQHSTAQHSTAQHSTAPAHLHTSVLYLGWRSTGRSSSRPWANCRQVKRG